jgi:hypothetical protein
MASTARSASKLNQQLENKQTIQHNYASMKKPLFAAVFAVFNLALCFCDENAQNAVERFNTDWNISIFSGYKYLLFLYGADEFASPNRPVDIGLGLSYKDWGFSLSMPFPFFFEENKSPQTIDGAFSYCNDFIYGQFSFKIYKGFHIADAEEIPLELSISTATLQGMYILNKEHSLRSIVNLDRLQNISNGSFLFGGAVAFTSIQSDDIPAYNEESRYAHIGPAAAYSYTFIFKNHLFINLFLNAGVDLCINRDSRNVSVTPRINPKIAIGKHNSSWSFKFELVVDYFSLSENYTLWDAIQSQSAYLTVTKRL